MWWSSAWPALTVSRSCPLLDLEDGGPDEPPTVISHEHRAGQPTLEQVALARREPGLIQ